MKLAALLICLISGISVSAQDNKESELLDLLNSVLRSSPHHHWAYEGMRMEIDSPFAIRDDVLSMTVSYRSDSAFYRERMEAPLSHMHSVVVDVYLILYFKKREVSTFYSTGEGWEADPRNIFHIGFPTSEGTVDSLRIALSEYLNRKDLLPPTRYYTDDLGSDPEFSEGLKLVEHEGRFGYIDTGRMVVIPFQFDYGQDFSEGLAAVAKNGSWGYIDRSGKVIISLLFSEASDFVNGKAEVVFRNKWYVIDRKGSMKRKKRWWF